MNLNHLILNVFKTNSFGVSIVWIGMSLNIKELPCDAIYIYDDRICWDLVMLISFKTIGIFCVHMIFYCEARSNPLIIL